MSVLDIVLLALLILGFVRGFIKGLFVEIASLLALLLGIYGSIHFSYFVTNFLEPRVDWNENTINVVAFGVTFLIIILAIIFAGKALTKLADFVMLGFLNKLLGGLFGLIKFGFILSVLLVIFSKLNPTFKFVDEKHIDESVLYAPIKATVPLVFPNLFKIEELNAEELIDSITEED